MNSSDLKTIERINVWGKGSNSLKSGDFSGLTSLRVLILADNSLSSLPEDLFDGLTSLETLWLFDNSLSSLPEDLFDGLTSLRILHLEDNFLSSLPEDLFDGLTSLETLWLYRNSLSSLPEDLFDGLTSLETLDLSNNSLPSLPEDLFDGLTSLKTLWLYGNSLSSLPEDLFDGLTSLETLWLYENSLSSLPEDLFDGLTSLKVLELDDNDLSSLPEDLFDGLTSLRVLYLSGNSLSSLPEDLFDGLTSLGELYLDDNSLSSLPADLFDHVTHPQELDVDLRENPITCLPPAIVNNSAVRITSDVPLPACDVGMTVTLSLSRISISENEGSTTVTARLDQPSSAGTTISVSAAPQSPALESDYKLSPNIILTIAAGQTTSTGMVTITAVDNDVAAPDKMVTVQGTATNTQGITGPADVTLIITDDDVASLEAPASVGVTEGSSRNLSVELSAQPTADVTVTVTGHASTDLTVAPITLIFTSTDWNTRQTVALTAAEDDDFVNDDVRLMLTASGGGYTGVTHSVAVTITDNDMASVVALASVGVTEGSSRNLSVELSAQPTADVTVTVTGHASTDLTVAPITLIFTSTDWNTRQTVALTAAEDDDFVNDDVRLMLTASGGGYTGVTHSVAVTITDNDMASVVALASVGVTEGSSRNLSVELSAQPTADVTVTVTGHASTDLTVAPITLIFTSTDWDTRQTVALTAAEDHDFTDDQVALTLTASGGGYTGVTHSVAVTITDNDMASLEAPASAVVPEGSSRNLSVALSRRPTAAVRVTAAGHATTDLTVAPITLIFTTTDWSTMQTVALTAAEDSDFVNDNVRLTLTASGGGYTGVTHSVAVTITDNDVASLEAPASAVVPEGSSRNLSVALSRQPTAAVTVTVTGHASTDLTVAPITLIFTTTDWSTMQTVALTAAEDHDFTDDQVALTLTASGGGYTGVTHSVAVTITDNDVASLKALASAVVPEGSSRNLSVALSRRPTAAVRVTAAGHATTDLTVAPITLIFTTTDWSTMQTVALTAEEDGDFVNDNVRLTLTASGAEEYAGVTHSVAVTITDNDVASLKAPASAVVPEGSSHNLSVELSAQPTAAVTVTVTGHASTDLTVAPITLIFTSTDWNTRQTVALTAEEDHDFTDDQVALTLTASGAEEYAGVTHSVAVTITDNDVASLKALASAVVPEGSSRNLSVALSRQPTAAVRVTAAGHATTDLTVAPITLIFTSTDWSTMQTMALTAEEDHDFTDDQVALTLTASGGGYTGVTHSVAVTITDNDVASLEAPASAVVPEGSSRNLSVELSAQPTADVTVTVAGHATTDLTPTPTMLIFTASDWNVPKTIDLTAEEDHDFADDQVALTLTASGGGYDGATADIQVTITDNDEESPLAISIQDAQGSEDVGNLQLPITLNRSTDQVVIVQYGTTDGTAEVDLDYTASRGIVLFDPGAVRGVIEIEISDDDFPEEAETFAVTLSNPRNAIIGRAAGTGTILDDDGGSAIVRVDDALVLAEEGMVRFRVHLSHPSSELITVGYRTGDGTAKADEDYRASAGVLRFAAGTVEAIIAVPLLKDGLDWHEETFTVHLVSSKNAEIAKAVGVARIQKAASVSKSVLAAYAGRFVRTSSVQIVEALEDRFRAAADGAACGAAARADLVRLWHSASPWDPSLGELLSGCRVSKSTVLSGGAVRVWGRGAFRQFSGQTDDALTLRAEVTTGLFGVDYGWNARWVAGLLLAHSRGEGSFAVDEDSGDIQSRLTGVYPYVSYQSRVGGIWMTGGYGRGQAEVSELAGDLGSGFGALGIRGALSSMRSVGLAYYGDVLYADAEISREDVRAQVYRIRLGLEADVRIRDEIRPYVAANVRQDGGSAETGLGLELGAGVRVAVPAWRLRADVRTQGLVVHTADGFTEWGISGSLQFGEAPTGWSLLVRPSWGPGPGMSGYHQQTVLDAVSMGRGTHRTEMELGYGIPLGNGGVRSVLGMTRLSEGALYRLGGELRPWDRFTLSVFGLAHAHAAAPGEIGLNVQGALRY